MPKTIIDLSDVSLRCAGKTILRNISWQVQEKENWVILGLNGSGKTTLLSLLNGYLFPSSGEAEVLGYRFGKAPIASLRKRIGWISSALQLNIPPRETPLEIVLSGKFASIGLWEEVDWDDMEKAESILAQLGLARLKDRTYESLSQGERQKVMIGRSLMNDPDILIFDEAYNGLDIFATKDLDALITQFALGEKTVIFVTHNTEEILPVFQHALLLKDGAVHSQGAIGEMIGIDNLNDFYGDEVEIFERDGHFFIYAK